MGRSPFAAMIVTIALLHALPSTAQEVSPQAQVRFTSLSGLTVNSLRKRRFGSELQIESDLRKSAAHDEYERAFPVTGDDAYTSVLASYRSDGLRIYTRIDVPLRRPPTGGFPVVVFMHGWVGYDAAEHFHFSYAPSSIYADWIDRYVRAGYVVITPGYRGHGTVNGRVADGRESMRVWDNETHVSPILYAIDTLNLIDGLQTLHSVDWRNWGRPDAKAQLNLNRLFIVGHSQGGDAGLIVMAVASDGSQVRHKVAAGSIISGTFVDRFTQLETYDPMSKASDAFLAGDGTWTSTAQGAHGEINKSFVFGWPSDAIENPDPAQWTWQRERYGKETVRAVVYSDYAKMYEELRGQVTDLKDIRLGAFNASAAPIQDPKVRDAVQSLGAYYTPETIHAPISFHFSDRDYYSFPVWNRDICNRINASGGHCHSYEYKGNTHSLRLSPHKWFSPEGSVAGYVDAWNRDNGLFETSISHR